MLRERVSLREESRKGNGGNKVGNIFEYLLQKFKTSNLLFTLIELIVFIHYKLQFLITKCFKNIFLSYNIKKTIGDKQIIRWSFIVKLSKAIHNSF